MRPKNLRFNYKRAARLGQQDMGFGMFPEAYQATPPIGEARPCNSVAFVLRFFKKTQPSAKIIARESVSETSLPAGRRHGT
jgi:hypothetical protein